MWNCKALLVLFFLLFLVLLADAAAGFNGRQVHDSERKFIIGNESLAPLASTVLMFDPTTAQTNEGKPETNGSFVLADHRTNRPDVLNGLRRYRGGWDFTNKHYWASVIFTGFGAFAVGLIWFILFGFTLVMIYGCKWKVDFGRKKCCRAGWICLSLLFVFTCVATIGCILLSVGQDGFHKGVSSTLQFVVNQSDFTVQNLRNVSEYLSLAKTINVEEVSLPSDNLSEIDKLNNELSSSADMLDEKTAENSIKVQKARNAVRCTLVVMAIIMLLLSVLGLILSILRYRHAMFIFVLIGWLLVALAFIFCGAFVIVDNAITDTCVSMKEWVDNSQAESALSNILPCVDERTTNRTLYQSKKIINGIVNVVNTAINTSANSNPSPHHAHYINQSGPPMPSLCSPFDSQLRDRQCLPEEVSFFNASQVWQNYICMVSSQEVCISPGRVTPDAYQQLVTAVNVSYALYHYTPFLLNLQNCNFVRDTFNTITTSYCPRLERRLKLVVAGLVLISVGVMLCLVLWILYANRPRREEEFVHTPVVKVTTNHTNDKMEP
ncbi:hypothetical protein EJ110_NYTH23323 [Nymphaea thermarum]|nr:hypothetical protein EJ110_NYTH23323 [Nymphaea thermarum]